MKCNKKETVMAVTASSGKLSGSSNISIFILSQEVLYV